MIQFLVHHFLDLIPILSCGLVGSIIVLERFFSLYIGFPLNDDSVFFDKIRRYILDDRISDAVNVCNGMNNKLISWVVKEGLVRSNQPLELVEYGLEVKVSEATEKLKERTNLLSMIANVSTLLGLIGTIMGLIQSFEAVGTANAQERSAMLAQGISVAMNHTLWGLAIAVPCMVCYSFLMGKANQQKSKIEQAAVKTMDLLKQRYVITAQHSQRKE